MNETRTRIRSLWQLTIRLRKLTEAEAWTPPLGSEARQVNHQLDDLSDEVERLIWRLDGHPNDPNP